jgi:hypothetical protein
MFDVSLTGIRFFFGFSPEPRTFVGVFLATGAQNPPSASLTRQSRFDPRFPQAAGHFLFWRDDSLRFPRAMLPLTGLEPGAGTHVRSNGADSAIA